MRRFAVVLWVAAFLAAAGCNSPDPGTDPGLAGGEFAKGADVSWLTEMESDGCKFYARSGGEMDCLALLRELGVNAVRLRVWVDPAGGWCGKEDVVAKACRAKAWGMRVMIDFHYSDSWADPGKQNKPAAWKDLSFSQLRQAVTDHTTTVLTALRDAGVTPEWIQIGNETTGGMLWPDGQNYTDLGFSRYVQLHNAGYSAAKDVFPHAAVVIHVDNGQDAATLDWFFRNCAQHGARYDLIGLSLYPDAGAWRQYTQQFMANVNSLYLKYEKACILCEVGMNWMEEVACNSFLTALIAASQDELAGRFLGIFYWEPEGYQAWSGYGKSAFDNGGHPTMALSAFTN